MNRIKWLVFVSLLTGSVSLAAETVRVFESQVMAPVDQTEVADAPIRNLSVPLNRRPDKRNLSFPLYRGSTTPERIVRPIRRPRQPRADPQWIDDWLKKMHDVPEQAEAIKKMIEDAKRRKAIKKKSSEIMI